MQMESLITQPNRLPSATAFFVWLCVCLLTPLAAISTEALTAEEKQFRDALNSKGAIVLMRHALAPGTGDPDRFSETDCSTQRNLSQQGREQAVRIGEALKDLGEGPFSIYSSAWCRCMDTAKLLDLGTVKKLPALNSFFRQWEREELQTRQLIEWMAQRQSADLAVLVTHQVNITTISGVYPASGEMVVLALDSDKNVIVRAQLALE